MANGSELEFSRLLVHTLAVPFVADFLEVREKFPGATLEAVG